MKRLFIILCLLLIPAIALGWGVALMGLPGGGPAYSFDFTSSYADASGDLGSVAVNRVSGAWVMDSADSELKLLRGDRTQYIQQTWKFDSTTAYWIATNVNANTRGIADPSGGSDATIVTETVANGAHQLNRNNIGSARYYVYSVFAKPNTRTWMQLLLYNDTTTRGYYQSFNLTTGAAGTGVAGVGGGSIITATSEAVSGYAGWRRYWIVVDMGAITPTNTSVYIRLATADATVNYMGDGSSIYIYNANLTVLEGPEAIPGDELIATQVDRDFSGASNWANVDINAYDETTGGDLTITANGIGQYCTLPVANATMKPNHIYMLEFDVANIASTWTIKDFDGGFTIGTVSANGADQKIIFAYSDTSSGGIRIVSVANDSSADFDNFSLKEITMPGGYDDGWEPGPAVTCSGATGTVPSNVGITANGLSGQGGQMINWALRPRVLNGANWAATNITPAAGIGIDGQSKTIKLTATAANGTLIHDAITTPTTATHCTSAYFKRVTGTGKIYITDNNGTNWTEVTGINSTTWTRKFITRSQAAPQIGFKIETDTDAVLVDCSELINNQAYPSLYWVGIPDGDNTSPVGMTGETGSATNGYYNTMSAAFKALTEGTAYWKFKFGFPETSHAAANHGWASLSAAANWMRYDGTNIESQDSAASVAGVAGPAWVYGDTLEVALIWPSSTGKFQLGYSWNGAAWVWSAEANFTSFTYATKLAWFWGNAYPQWIEKFDVYNKAYTTTWVESKY